MADEPNKDEEIPVEIIDGDDQIEARVEGEKKPDAEPAKIVSGEEGAEELKRRLDAETQRREAAEAVARAAAEDAAKARGTVEDSELREIETSIAVTKRNLELAKQQFRQARSSNDLDAETEAMEAVAQAKADLNALEAGKVAREHAKKNPQVQSQQFRQDPVEVVVNSLQNWPQSQAWVRQHPDMARDPAKWRATVAASDLALAKGLAADTPAYFAHIEGTLQANGILPVSGSSNGNGNGTIQKTEESAMSQASRPVAPAAAPPSRSGSSAQTGQRPGTIRLTREQAEIAELSFPNLVKEKGAAAAHREYAKSLVELKANGKMN